MEQAFKTVRDQLGQALQRFKQAYDGRIQEATVQSGRPGVVRFPQKTVSSGIEVEIFVLITGPWRLEKVLNSVIYVIRRVGGRDRRVVHVDRLQRYDKAVKDNINFTSRRRPEGDKLPDQPRSEGDNLTGRPGRRRFQ